LLPLTAVAFTVMLFVCGFVAGPAAVPVTLTVTVQDDGAADNVPPERETLVAVGVEAVPPIQLVEAGPAMTRPGAVAVKSSVKVIPVNAPPKLLIVIVIDVVPPTLIAGAPNALVTAKPFVTTIIGVVVMVPHAAGAGPPFMEFTVTQFVEIVPDALMSSTVNVTMQVAPAAKVGMENDTLVSPFAGTGLKTPPVQLVVALGGTATLKPVAMARRLSVKLTLVRSVKTFGFVRVMVTVESVPVGTEAGLNTLVVAVGCAAKMPRSSTFGTEVSGVTTKVDSLTSYMAPKSPPPAP
jgi:hypothetical protein